MECLIQYFSQMPLIYVTQAVMDDVEGKHQIKGQVRQHYLPLHKSQTPRTSQSARTDQAARPAKIPALGAKSLTRE
ncbi:hypothetical protein CHS0354_017142 [Potamilus streckersoni]|uniref:Uncharacterized protein n=1 Tax=Potamilus streckersoni TaxID=2493646 RepID=A0AAE0TEN3_9BIVA|nr:hypothetical protein CHS0354_017142 [Potamilus streckersoni]